ncbi:hypothetical protein DFH08DRAFT_211659 [Mycena albidolilacea]|uniref:Uncharacterized protein n=1 Tax=Mycena albidolilacea TaxID=1033008 RepID=A0AAD6ZZY0_9AGAR|nr:hypothetical protein DFH08DRAFT_211659 [Mycena albidolilacea]
MLSLSALPRLLLFTSLLSGVHCAKDDESRSVALLTPVLPLKQQQVQPREKVIRGLLHSRQDLSCDFGYGLCPNQRCCLIGEECCSGGGCCAIGYYCVATGCCPEGETCGTRTRKTPVGAIAGGVVAGVFLLASGIFILIRRRRNRTQPLPAHGTGILVTPTPAEQKPDSAYSPSQVQAVTLPSSVGGMSQNPAGGYSQHQVVHPAPSYSTTISPAVPPSLHGPYSQPGGTYAAPPHPTTISSTGGTKSTDGRGS